MLLSEAIGLYVADRQASGEISERSARQLEWRLATLSACHPGLEISELSRTHVRAWQHATGWQRPASRRAYLSTLRVFCAWAVAAGQLGADPTAGLARIREPRPLARQLADAELARLTLVLPDERARLIVGLMRHGLRCIEVARLTAADYDAGGPRLWVWGKNDQLRRVPVRPWLVVTLDRRVLERPTGPLVGISAQRISRLVSQWFDQAGIKVAPRDGRSAHALRHTAAGQVLAECGNVNTVKDFLGHQSLATTTRYLPDTAEADMRAAMAGI